MKVYLQNQGLRQKIYALFQSFYPYQSIVYSESNDNQTTWAIFEREDSFFVVHRQIRRGILAKQTEDKQATSLRRCCYDFWQTETGKTLPWGILTGVRPTKIVHQCDLRMFGGKLGQENQLEETAKLQMALWRDYRLSNKKATLLYRVYEKEKEVMARRLRQGVHLYIHIPFCSSRCYYCSFPVAISRQGTTMVADYVKNLLVELEGLASVLRRMPIRTVYIGGGTPTILTISQLKVLFEKLWQIVDVTMLEEATIEAGRPDSLNQQKLQIIHDYCFGRISINPQTFHDSSLKIIGRGHTKADIYQIFELARTIGFDNINMDLILGLAGEDRAMILESIEKVIALAPDSITLHSLAKKRRALGRSGQLLEEKLKVKWPMVSGLNQLLDQTNRRLMDEEYQPYYLYRQKESIENLENIGFAKPMKECLYNIEMMEERESIIALGAGSISKHVTTQLEKGQQKRIIRRLASPKDWRLYQRELPAIVATKKAFIRKMRD